MNRRDFLKLTSVAGAGLIVGLPLSSQTTGMGPFLQIGTDDVVTIWVTKSEMGQGVRTALPMIVAEELDADFARVRVLQAHFDPKFGRQGTGGSGSVRTMWTPLRQAGAKARAMLVAAAAARWGVEESQIAVANGVVTAGTHRATFGELAEAAARVALTGEPKLKDPGAFRLIGTSPRRVDLDDILSGRAKYGIDTVVPGMLYAAVARARVFGAKVASFDAAAAKAVKGVRDVVRVDARGVELPWNGVAVIATSTWAALRGRDALRVEWDEGQRESTGQLRRNLHQALDATATIASHGDAAAAIATAAKKVEAEYTTPFLAHAPMEPMNAVADVRDDDVEIWAPTQFPDRVNAAVAEALGVPPQRVRVNVTLLGGGFGRRINCDYAVEAALIAKAAGAPVKVQWTREDDIQHDFYHPASCHRVSAALDENGAIAAWHHRFTSTSKRAYTEPQSTTYHDSENGGLSDLSRISPALRIDYAHVPSAVPRGSWRAVAHATNGFVICSFLDELATAAGRDPIDFYLAHYPAGKVDEHPTLKEFSFRNDRFRRVIELAREKSGWRGAAPAGRARGFAAYFAFVTYVAQVAEVSIVDGRPKVHRVVCVIDCGVPVNPDGIRAQVEGGILFGLAAALGQQITVENGHVRESNFHDFPLPTMADMPRIEVHIVPSAEAPTGTGEPGLPPIASAVANAMFKLTGKRMRTLPFA